MSIGIAKAAIELVVGLGVGAVVSNAVKATTPDNLKIVGKIIVGVGSVVVTSAVSDIAARHVTNQVDEVVSNIKDTKSKKKQESEDVA